MPKEKGARRIPLKLKKAVKLASSDKLGLYASWAIVSREKNSDGEWESYKDLQGDTVSDATLVETFVEGFGEPVPIYKDHNMKDRKIRGSVVFAPMTEDIQKGLGLEGDVSGLVAFMYVDDKKLRKSIDAGELPDVSIEARVVVATDA